MLRPECISETMTLPSTLSEFLAHLQGLDIRLTLDGDRLGVNAPKGALTPEIKAGLQQRKAEILEFLRSAAQSNTASGPPLVPRSGGPREGAPLSFSQQRLWFLDRMAPGDPMYNIAGGLLLRGKLDRPALEASLRHIVQRHESLRTAFRDVDGAPRSVVVPADTWSMDVVSLLDSPEDGRIDEARRLALVEAQRPFDLAEGVLFRATLFILGEHEHLLLVIMHHIVSDGWSLGVCIHELSQLYSAFHEQKADPLPPLPVQYGDYAEWHRRWLESGVLASELPYWKQTLAPPLPVLDLPLDHPRPPIQTHNGRRVTYRLPESLTEGLKQLSYQENVTLFMTLLSGFQILLSRYTGQSDVIVGTAVANRERPEVAGLIGFFVNNLVLRTDLSGNPTVREVLARVRTVALDSFAHQDVPFDRLVEILRPERMLDRPPLFQTMFILQNWPFTELQLPDLSIEPFPLESGTSRFDLSIEAIERKNTLECDFEFNTDLFDLASITRLQGHFEAVLSGMVENPESRMSDLPLLGTRELQQQLTEWNATDALFPAGQCADQLIDAQAARTPDAVAVRYGDATLTYRELIRRATQLAHRLRKLGVAPDTLVGICVERSEEMVVALLAVWKAGGAYVPLDPSYPQERLAFMAADAGLVALVTEEALLSYVAAPECPVVCLDRDRDSIAAEPETSLESTRTPDHLAYVIYTSGSTGKPKGVLIEHRSLVNFLYAMQQTFGLTVTDRLLSVTTLSFDIAGLELYLPLSTGAQVVLASRSVASDGQLLAATMRDAQITMMQATPATWRLLLESGWSDGQGLTILCGGEALPPQLANALLGTGAKLWNMYGPTETTIWSTMHQVEPGDDPLPIGRPIANTTIYILDEHHAPVPVNVSGELYIGGAGLARGYHNRPELTAERFIPDPFSTVPGARLYRTGDKVRYRQDGVIEYMGRLDHQVKVRGFRIELGEIESVLATHDRIKQAAVVVREDTPGDQRIVAYLIATPGDSFTGSPLRAWLGEFLPQFMLPSTFVVLDAFPMTPNGKVDRRALPAPTDLAQPSAATFVSPRSGAESTVAEIWREILRVERVGADDNFFDLGGHSLLVVQLQSRLRDRFQREVSLMELFRRPTVSTLAQYFSDANATSSFSSSQKQARNTVHSQHLATAVE